MTAKTIDMEMIRSKLSDAYISGKNWEDVEFLFPEIEKSLFDEVSKEIKLKLTLGKSLLRPMDLYQGMGLEADSCAQGLDVSEVYKDCPASKIGLMVGDVITKINFQSVGDLDLFSALSMLRNCQYPQGAIIEVIRAGETMTLGYGLNISPKVIDVKKKYPMNFTALTIGRRMMGFKGMQSIGSGAKALANNRSFEMAR